MSGPAKQNKENIGHRPEGGLCTMTNFWLGVFYFSFYLYLQDASKRQICILWVSASSAFHLCHRRLADDSDIRVGVGHHISIKLSKYCSHILYFHKLSCQSFGWLSSFWPATIMNYKNTFNRPETLDSFSVLLSYLPGFFRQGKLNHRSTWVTRCLSSKNKWEFSGVLAVETTSTLLNSDKILNFLQSSSGSAIVAHNWELFPFGTETDCQQNFHIHAYNDPPALLTIIKMEIKVLG